MIIGKDSIVSVATTGFYPKMGKIWQSECIISFSNDTSNEEYDLMAYATFHRDLSNHRWEIDYFETIPKYRNAGIGTLMENAIMNYCKYRGTLNMHEIALLSSPESKSFWKNRGYYFFSPDFCHVEDKRVAVELLDDREKVLFDKGKLREFMQFGEKMVNITREQRLETDEFTRHMIKNMLGF